MRNKRKPIDIHLNYVYSLYNLIPETESMDYPVNIYGHPP